MMLHIEPRALVLRFVLYPDEFLNVRVALHFSFELFVSKGIELLDTNDGYIIALTFFTLLDQIIVHLARANHHACDLFGFDVLINLTNNREELTRSEEHTSELQSRGHLVCRLLLEKKKKTQTNISTISLTQN